MSKRKKLKKVWDSERQWAAKKEALLKPAALTITAHSEDDVELLDIL